MICVYSFAPRTFCENLVGQGLLAIWHGFDTRDIKDLSRLDRRTVSAQNKGRLHRSDDLRNLKSLLFATTCGRTARRTQQRKKRVREGTQRGMRLTDSLTITTAQACSLQCSPSEFVTRSTEMLKQQQDTMDGPTYNTKHGVAYRPSS